MPTIAFEDGGTQEETVSAFLMLVLEEAQESGLFGIHGLLDRLVCERYSIYGHLIR